MVGENLFHGIDPEHHEYRRRAHLAEMISLLGPPSPGPLSQGELWSKFFSEDGNSNLSTFPNFSFVNQSNVRIRGIPWWHRNTASYLFGTAGGFPK